ncbi:MAG: hypothetical protein H0U50_06005 [Pyrinomonadaceae bacterium]|nr:hypothetical protein [Pyrinomonadaceae bacterium]
MKYLFAFALLLGCLFFINNRDSCSLAQSSDNDLGPKRLIIIQGKAMILNHPDLGKTPTTSETIIFQKVDCKSCFIGTNTDIDGNYKITVGDGKYRVIVRNPSSPEFDMLAPNQERFIDTETLEAKKYSKQVFDFDINIKLPESK